MKHRKTKRSKLPQLSDTAKLLIAIKAHAKISDVKLAAKLSVRREHVTRLRAGSKRHSFQLGTRVVDLAHRLKVPVPKHHQLT